MADDINIDLALDPSMYLAGVQQMTQANTGLAQSFSPVIVQSAMAQRAIDAMTPKRATLVAWGGLATMAAQSEQGYAKMAAQATVTHANVERLTGGVRKLAQTMPVGNQGGKAIVEQITSMGVASEGSEKRVLSLATTVGKLSGATGEGPAQLAQGMIELSRATGNTNLDPKRFSAIADSVTSVSAQTGAGATNILAFSKNIAPMAQSAGLGSTAILGISGAFAKMGEDGIGASTAVNKMLGDLSRSAREGTPEIAAYAQIVGKTTDEFQKLFKANPTEALTQVTEALAKNPQAAPRQLEMLGLDGPRTTRYLTALAAQGGLRGAVAGAVGAYDSGSTEKASQAAYRGLNDSLTELQSSAEQVGKAMGAPLLGPLTAFTKALQLPARGLSNLLNSKPAQDLGSAAVWTMITGMIGARIARTLAAGGIIRQVMTSGPIRSIAAGLSAGTGRPAVGAGSSAVSRFGAPITAAVQQGRLGPANSRIYDFTRGLFTPTGSRYPGAPGGLSWAQRGQMLMGAGATGVDAWLKTVRGTGMNQAESDPTMRRMVGTGAMASTPWRGFGNEVRSVWSGRHAFDMSSNRPVHPSVNGQTEQFLKANPYLANQFANPNLQKIKLDTPDPLGFKGVGKAAESLQQRLIKAGEGAGMFQRLAYGAASAAAGTARSGASVVGGAAGLAGRGISAFAGSRLGQILSPAMLGMTAIVGLTEAAMKSRQSRKDEMEELSNRDISSTLNRYRDSIGKATGPAITHASLTESMGKNLAATVTSPGQATRVTAEDLAVGRGSIGKVLNRFQGNQQQVISQVRALSPNGMSPDELQAVKYDLIRQHPNDPAFVENVMRGLGSDFTNAAGTKETGSGADDFRNIMRAANQAPGAGGLSGFLHATGMNDNSMKGYNNTHVGPKWLQNTLGAFNTGGIWHKSTLTDDTNKMIDNAVDASDKRYVDQSNTYGHSYAQQERLKGANAMLQEAAATGDADVFDRVARSITQNLTGKQGGYQMTGRDLDKYHGDVGAFLASQDKEFAKGQKELEAERKKAGGNIDATEIQSAVSKNLAGISPAMAAFFDARKGTSATNAVAASLDKAGDVTALEKAAASMVQSTTDSGKSLSQLGSEAIKAANNLSEASQEFAIVKAAQRRAELGQTYQQVGMTPQAAQMAQMDQTYAKATQDARNGTQMAEKQAAQQQFAEQGAAVKQQLVARLQMQREYEISVTRATEDYQRQRQYSIADYNTQVTRLTESANIQRKRSEEDYQISVTQATEDFNIQRGHQIRDFNISARRSEEDYLKQRSRMIRDYNTGVARMIEDAAKTMYDPYARIQTKATYDAQNLMLNLREQNEAMAKQKSQLDRLREMGLSGQAIDQLGLGKAENAQQLNNIMADATTDPRVLAQLNAVAKQRGALAGALVTDDSNTDYKRQRQDFNKGLKDMAADRRTSLKRSREDLARSLSDENQAFEKSLKRGAEAHDRNAQRVAADLARTLGQMAADQAKNLSRQETALETSLGRMEADVKRSDEVINGSFTELSDAVSKSMAGQVGTYSKLIVNQTAQAVKDVRTKVIPEWNKVQKELGLDISSNTSSGGVAKSSGGGTATAGGRVNNGLRYAEGGKIAGSSPHPKADNIPIWATAGEFMHPVDVVNHYGADTLEAMRQKKIPKEVFAGFAEGGLLEFGNLLKRKGYAVSEHPKFGGVHPVHTVGSQHYNKQGPGGGGAIDVNADPFNSPFKNEVAAINAIVGLAGQYGLRTIWQTAGHFNHAHFDISKNGDMVGKAVANLIGARAASGAGADMAAAVDRAIGKMDQKKGGWYGKIREQLRADMHAAFDSMGAGPGPAGDTGAHSTSARANQAIARRLLGSFGWGMDQMAPLIKLWNGESGWNQFADNPSSDAYGIPQALPGSKMASAGKDWRTNPETQIRWGLGYIKNRPDYGSPARAWEMWNSRNPHWYDKGGKLKPGSTLVQNDTNKVEAVLTDDQWRDIHQLSELAGTMLTQDQGRSLQAAGGVHMTVHNNQSYTYDQRNDFSDASIVVQSQDPDDMGRKLEARAARGRLTQTRGVRRGG